MMMVMMIMLLMMMLLLMMMIMIMIMIIIEYDEDDVTTQHDRGYLNPSAWNLAREGRWKHPKWKHPSEGRWMCEVTREQ